jgi:hypothetical protein
MACIQQLPEEILAGILSLVAAADGEDFLETRGVCRLWRAVSSKITRLHWRIYPVDDAAALVSFLLSEERAGTQLSSLHLVFSQSALVTVPAKLFVAAIRHLLPPAVFIRTCGSTLSNINWPLYIVHDDVRTYENGHLVKSTGFSPLCNALMQSGRLEELQVKDRYERFLFPIAMAASASLKKLRLVKMEISKDQLENLVAACPGLETLEWEDLVHSKVEIVIKSSNLKQLSCKEEFFCRYKDYALKVAAKNLVSLNADYGLLTIDTPNLKELNTVTLSRRKLKLPKLLSLRLRGEGKEFLSMGLDILKSCPQLQHLDVGMQDYAPAARYPGLHNFVYCLPPRLQILHIDKELLEALGFGTIRGVHTKHLVGMRVYNLFNEDSSFAQVYANLRSLVRACAALTMLELVFVSDTTNLEAIHSLVSEDFKNIETVAISVQR